MMNANAEIRFIEDEKEFATWVLDKVRFSTRTIEIPVALEQRLRDLELKLLNRGALTFVPVTLNSVTRAMTAFNRTKDAVARRSEASILLLASFGSMVESFEFGFDVSASDVAMTALDEWDHSDYLLTSNLSDDSVHVVSTAKTLRTYGVVIDIWFEREVRLSCQNDRSYLEAKQALNSTG